MLDMQSHPKKAHGRSLLVETVFGDMQVKEPVLIDLIASKAVQRLKKIRQFGISHYAQIPFDYSRYDHSIGVLYLLKKVNVGILEQIAGLLHDVSHTVFSHVGDVVFARAESKSSYQDDIHEWFINQTDIPEILQRHGITVQQILHKNKSFTALESELPDICADRLEYILDEAVLSGMITQKKMHQILNAVHFDNDRWYFSDERAARAVADIALYLTEFHFGAPWNAATYQWAAQALKYALYKDIISNEELHFSTDDIIWQRMVSSNDTYLKMMTTKILTTAKDFLSTPDNYDIHIKPKFRGVDPLVLVDNSLIRLSELDKEFNEEFERVKALMNQGLYLKL